MRVPKVPRRYDFCGYPPCGLCFDEVEPAPPVPEEDPQEIRVDGLIAMTEELTGKPFAETTESEKLTVKGIAEDLHNKAIVEKINGKPPPDSEANPDEDKWFCEQINAAGKARRVEKAYQEKLNRPKSLDQMDWGASEEAKQVLEEAGQQQEKDLKKAAEQEKKKEKTAKEKAREEQEAAIQRILGEAMGRKGPFR